MHELVGQRPVVGEDQQARGVGVQASHGDPAAAPEARQCLEDRGTAFRILAGGEFAFGLVVEDHAAARVAAPLQGLHRPAVYAHPVGIADAVAELSGLAVDADAALGYPTFDLTSRSQAGGSEDLLDAFRAVGPGFHQWVVTPDSPSSSMAEASSSARRGTAAGAASAGMASMPRSSSALMLSMSRSCASVGSSSRLFRLK